MPTDIQPRRPSRSGPERAVDDALNEIRRRTSKWGGWGTMLAIIAVWLASGIYQVNPSEVGIVLRFGRYHQTTPPGLHWRVPQPFDTVTKVPVTVVRKEEIGFRTVSVGPPARYRSVVEESRMLTSDGNILDLDFIVQYRIADPVAYLFRVRHPVETLRDCAESAMREVIGRSTIDIALTEGRGAIQIEAQDLLQGMLDSYDSGLNVTTVKLQDVTPPDDVQDAFKDVISAEQDKERMINEAEGFANDILPKARGTAAQRLNEAQAYTESIVKEAEGESGRFDLIRKAYEQAPEITRTRMYLETMETVLPGAHKVIVSSSVAGSVLPLLPLAGENSQFPATATGTSKAPPGGNR